MKIAILAGEISGDIIAADLVSELKKKYPDAQFIGICGDNMQRVGVRKLASINSLSVGGLVEILPKLPKLFIFRRQILKLLIAEQPDFIVGVDAPDFNLGLLKKLKARGFTTYQLVAPTLWAWRSWRIHKLRKSVNKVLCVYPFEQEWFSSRGVPTIFIGHPLANNIPITANALKAREEMKIDAQKTIITLLPGSRNSEIQKHSQLIVDTIKLIHKNFHPQKIEDENCADTHTNTEKFKRVVNLNDTDEESLATFNKSEIQFLVPIPSINTYEVFTQICQKKLSNMPVKLMRGHSQRAISVADFCVVASGTASLETALYKKPMAIFYKLNNLTYLLIKLLNKLPFVGLPNILIGKLVVKEFLQQAATPENLANECINTLQDKTKQVEIISAFTKLHKSLIVNNRDEILKTLFTK